MRYESLVASPRTEIARLVDFLGAPLKPSDFSFLDRSPIEVAPTHTVAGNPLRFHHGLIELRPDDEWRGRMRPRDRMIVTLLTWPLRLAYGYTR